MESVANDGQHLDAAADEEDVDPFDAVSEMVVRLNDAIESRRFEDLQAGIVTVQQWLIVNPDIDSFLKEQVRALWKSKYPDSSAVHWCHAENCSTTHAQMYVRQKHKKPQYFTSASTLRGYEINVFSIILITYHKHQIRTQSWM